MCAKHFSLGGMFKGSLEVKVTTKLCLEGWRKDYYHFKILTLPGLGPGDSAFYARFLTTEATRYKQTNLSCNTFIFIHFADPKLLQI